MQVELRTVKCMAVLCSKTQELSTPGFTYGSLCHVSPIPPSVRGGGHCLNPCAARHPALFPAQHHSGHVRGCCCCRLLACLTSQKHASVSQGRICSDNFTCCHTKIEVSDPTLHLTQSQYTDTGPTRPSADPITRGSWQGSHWSAKFEVTGMTRPRKKSRRRRDSNPGSSALEADALPLGQRGGHVRERETEGDLKRHEGGPSGEV